MPDEEKSDAADVERGYDEPQEESHSTKHNVTIDGHVLEYTATAGTLVLKEEAEKEGKAEGEKAKATIFYVAYHLDNVESPQDRPVTYSFNGGPGSSSVWLHLGILGPRRVKMADDVGNLPKPPFELVNNDFSLLDKTDLVFIDPVSTGYSRAVPGEKPKEFHDFEKDIEWVGEFIRLYTSRARRWTSPKFLIGESYGSTRAAELSGFLQEKHGMYFNGVMLISSVLEFQTLIFSPNNDVPHFLYLPSYAATAHYHEQLDPPLQDRPLKEVLDEAEDFALEEYALALLKGASLPAEERDEIAEKLALYTGLDVGYIKRSNLRVPILRFTKELLRADGHTVGRLDSRFKGVDRDSAGETFEFDPSYATIQGPYSSTFNDYVRRDLGFETDLPYEILNREVWPSWSYKKFENRFVDVADTLRKAMNINPYLQVFVASGYYDLATPYFATEYTFDHLDIPADRYENIHMKHYEAGHMMYQHMPSLAALKRDLAGFIEESA